MCSVTLTEQWRTDPPAVVRLYYQLAMDALGLCMNQLIEHGYNPDPQATIEACLRTHDAMHDQTGITSFMRQYVIASYPILVGPRKTDCWHTLAINLAARFAADCKARPFAEAAAGLQRFLCGEDLPTAPLAELLGGVLVEVQAEHKRAQAVFPQLLAQASAQTSKMIQATRTTRPPATRRTPRAALLATPGQVHLEKPLDWPPPVSLDWREECRYALERIKKVIEAEGAASAQTRSNPDGQPTGKPAAVANGPQVVLRGPGERPIVGGVDKGPLTLPQYDVVKALLEAGERGLSKDELDRKSKHGDARKILKRLAESDPDWNAVIHFPVKPGRGYRIG